MIDLKNIFDDIINEIQCMNDEDIIREMTGEGCIFLGKTKDTEIQFDLPVKYGWRDEYVHLLDSISFIENDYSEFEGVIAA